MRPDPERGRHAGRPSAGLVVALWSALSGMRHLVAAVSRAYDEEEKRGLIRLRGLSLILTIGAALARWSCCRHWSSYPTPFRMVGSAMVCTTLHVSRWPLLAIGAMVGLAVIYRSRAGRGSHRAR